MPPPTLTRGFLVSRQPYRETSILGLWFTDDFGPCRALILGANKPKSPHLHQLDLFYSHQLLLTQVPHGKLPIVKEIKILDAHLNLRRNLITLHTIRYFYELCESVSEPGGSAHAVSELLHKAAQYLTLKDPSAPLLRRFERALMHLSGLNGETESAFLNSMHSHHYKIPRIRTYLYKQLPPSQATPHVASHISTPQKIFDI